MNRFRLLLAVAAHALVVPKRHVARAPRRAAAIEPPSPAAVPRRGADAVRRVAWSGACFPSPRIVYEKGPTKARPPTYRECVAFAAPALAIYVAGPLLSLIDAGFVGRRSAAELAALGPAGTISDSATTLLVFLSVAVRAESTTQGKGGAIDHAKGGPQLTTQKTGDGNRTRKKREVGRSRPPDLGRRTETRQETQKEAQNRPRKKGRRREILASSRPPHGDAARNPEGAPESAAQKGATSGDVGRSLDTRGRRRETPGSLDTRAQRRHRPEARRWPGSRF